MRFAFLCNRMMHVQKKNIKIILFIILFGGLNNLSWSQCLNEQNAFQSGEKITYEIAYNWGLLWVDAGEVNFKADTKNFEGNQIYHFESVGKSYKFYDWMFKVRDTYKSKVESEMFHPVWFSRNTYEGGYVVNNSYDFDYINSRIIASLENSDQPKKTDTLELTPCTFDVLSAIYYARNIDFSNYSVGDKIPVKFIIDGEFFELYIRYLGKEIKENRSGKKYHCIKFSALLVEGTIFKDGEDLMVWVTDDNNKIPIMVEAKILIGSVKAYLIKAENLRHELSTVNSP